MIININHLNFDYQLDCHHRLTNGETILYLHGLGTSKDDFLSALDYEPLDSFNIISIDFPGCGKSNYNDKRALQVNDLVAIIHKVVEQLDLKTFHLIGHSMGGLTGLLYARQCSEKVKSFINVEGNLDMVDCRVFSKYVNDYPLEKGEANLIRDFKRRFAAYTNPEFEVFLKHFDNNVKFKALTDYCRSIVECCEQDSLLDYFTKLRIPKILIYGEENSDLHYLNSLQEQGVFISEISGSNHFPFYSNPEAFLKSVASFYLSLPSN